MDMIMCNNGDEYGIREAVQWLEAMGIPRTSIRGVAIAGDVGEPVIITATLYMTDPVITVVTDTGERARSEAASHAPTVCATCSPLIRWDADSGAGGTWTHLDPESSGRAPESSGHAAGVHDAWPVVR